MKKILMVAIILIASVSVYSQEFMGIKIDGGKDLVINQFKTKGFKVSPTNDPKLNYTSMEGTVNGKSMELLICHTPTSKIVWKLIVTLPKQNTWYDLKNEYEKYKDILVKKYGQPSDDFHFFSSPYDEGDGYEMTAVAVGKCTYSSYFTNQGNSVSIEISKWKEIDINYENEKNRLVKNKEKEALDSKVF